MRAVGRVEAPRSARRDRCATTLDAARIRADFPILSREIDGKPLAYLDSANSAQKPRQMIDAMSNFYATSYSNVHRAVYQLGVEATEAFEGTRKKVRDLLNAPSEREVIFTRDTTEAINLVAYSYGRTQPRPGRRDRHDRDRAPLEPRAVAGAGEGHRRRAALRAHRPARRAEAGRAGRDREGRQRQAAGGRRPVQLARHDQPDPRAGRLGARPRRRHPGGRRAVRAAPPGRRAGHGRRLPRVLRPQAVRPVRRRRPVGPPRAARGDAPVPHRRRDDPLRAARAARAGTSCPGSSRRARRPSPRSSAWAPRSTT